jgi:hypothetical protein
MPPSPVEDQDDLLGGGRPRLTSKGGEFGLEEGNTDAGRQMKEGATRRGMHEAHEVPPGVAVLDRRNRALANGRPDASQERFEANPVLVCRPQLDCSVGKCGRDLTQQRPYLFLNASCAAESACTCCGRGNCWLCLRRCR